MIGDLYTNQGFIEPNIIKSLQVITDESVHNALIWYFEQMADIKDVLELSVNAHEIQTSNWIDFLNLIRSIKDVLSSSKGGKRWSTFKILDSFHVINKNGKYSWKLFKLKWMLKKIIGLNITK